MILRPNSCGSATTHGPFKNHLHLFMGPKENKGGLSGKNRVVSSIASLQVRQTLMDLIYGGQYESSGN
jgi:hypothetical protein